MNYVETIETTELTTLGRIQ